MGSPHQRRRSSPRRYRPLRAEFLEPRTLLTLVPQLVVDINPGSASSAISGGPRIEVVGGNFITAVSDGAHGLELWKSDGTTGGTALVKDINPGGGGSDPRDLINVNGTLFFAATQSDDLAAKKLWKSDGTEAGTQVVSTAPVFPQCFANVNGTLFFSSIGNLWRSNGTPAGTVMVSNAGAPIACTQIVANGLLFYQAHDSAHGIEVWRSDGTATGTFMVKDIRPGPDSSPLFMGVAGSLLYFAADDGTHGYELWRSDGTIEGTFLLKDILPGPDGSSPYNFGDLNGTLLFGANDGVHGLQLWKSDGTPDGTILITDVDSDGLGLSPVGFSSCKGVLCFRGTDSVHGNELWMTDGTTTGTVLLKDIRPGPGSSNPPPIFNFGGGLYFGANDGIHGIELWRTDLTPEGTYLVGDIAPGAASSNVAIFQALPERMVFLANDVVHGRELWTLVDVNVAPSFVKGADQTAAEDSGPQSVSAWATGISPGPPDEAGQSLAFIVTTSNGSLFAVQPAIDPAGKLTYSPAPNANGSATVTVVLKDDGGTANGGSDTSPPQTFAIRITSVNDPALAAADTFTITDDTPFSLTAPGVLNNDSDVDGDSLLALLVAGPSAGTMALNVDGSFSYVPSPYFSGTDSFAYKVTDGAAVSSPVLVTLNVMAVKGASASGTVFADLDGNGQLDPTGGDSGLAGRTVYVDLNNNGRLDTASEPRQTTGADGKYGFANLPAGPVRISQVVPLNWRQTAPLGDPSVLALASSSILEYTRQGDLLQTIPVPKPVQPTHVWTLWDVVVDQAGRLHVFQGQFDQAYISTYTPWTKTWEHHRWPGLQSPSNGSDGEISVRGKYLYYGLTRLNLDDWSYTTFPYPSSLTGGLSDVRMGGNGKLYGFNAGSPRGTMYEFDPDTFALLRTLSLRGYDGQAITEMSVVVTPQGDIFAADSATVLLYHYDSKGNLLGYITIDDSWHSYDIDLSADGWLVLGEKTGGRVALIPTDMSSVNFFTIASAGFYLPTAFSTYQGAGQSPTSYFLQLGSGERRQDLNFGSQRMGTNSAPVAQDDYYIPTAGIPLTVGSTTGLLSNDSDQEGDSLAVFAEPLPSNGALWIGADGAFTFSPYSGFTGLDSFAYRVTDGTAVSNAKTVTLWVNAAPSTSGDNYTTSEDVPITVAAPGVLDNDSDAEGASLTATLVTSPKHGTVLLSSNGSFSYSPTKNFNGADSFTYRASDGNAVSAVTTVQLSVTSVNDLPIAVSNSYIVTDDIPRTVTGSGVLGNDSDADGDALTAVLVDSPVHGSLTLSSAGRFTYWPDGNFFGADRFTYLASDGQASSGVVTVSLTINAINDPPLANPDAYSATAGVTLTLDSPGVLGDDIDVEGDVLTALKLGSPVHGSLTLNSDGSFKYLATTGFEGIDSFTYRASDGQASSGIATVTINVTPVNDCLVVVNTSDTGAGSLREAINCANTRPGLDTINFNIPGAGVHTVSPASALPIITDPVVIDGFTQPGSSRNTNPFPQALNGTLLIELVGSGPVLNGLEITAGSSTVRGLVIRGFQNDGIVLREGGGNLVAGNYIGTNASGSEVSENVNYGVVLNSPGNHIGGLAPEARNLISGNGPIGSAGIGILGAASQGNVIQGNLIGTDAAGLAALPNVFGIVVLGGSSTTIGGSAAGAGNIISGNGDPKKAGAGIFINGPQPGTLIQGNLIGVGATGAALGNLGPGIQLASTSDTTISSNTVAFNATAAGTSAAGINVGFASTNNAITQNSIFQNVGLGIDLVPMGVTPNDSGDPDTGPNKLQNYPEIAAATRTGNALTITYTVPSTSVSSTYPLRVEFFEADSDGEEGQTFLSFDTFTTTDLAAGRKTIALLTATALASGDKLVSTATDAAGNTSEFSTDAVLVLVNSAPLAASDSYAISENTPLTVAAPGILTNDTDADGDPLSTVLEAGPAHGTLTPSASGAFSYSPAADYHGSDSFTYRASDGKANSDVVTVTISVKAANHAPVAHDDSFQTPQDKPLTIAAAGILTNDTDADGDSLTIQLADGKGPEHGSLSIGSDQSLVYTPNSGFFGTDSFSYFAWDGQVSSSAAVVTIEVVRGNALPSFTKGPDVAVTDESGTQTMDWAEEISQGSATGKLTFHTWTSNDALFLTLPTIDPLTGQLAFTPQPNVAGVAIVSVQLTAESGIAVQSHAAEPAADVQQFQITIDKPHRWHNSLPVDGDASHGSMEVDGDGSITSTDVLLIINYLNAGLPSAIPSHAPVANGLVLPFYDVDADDSVTPTDALLIINLLNGSQGGPIGGHEEVAPSQPPPTDFFFHELGDSAADPYSGQQRQFADWIAALTAEDSGLPKSSRRPW